MTRAVKPREPRRLVYASLGYTTHDRRFVTAAVDGGWHVSYVRFDGAANSLEDRSLPTGVEFADWEGVEHPVCSATLAAAIPSFMDLIEDLKPDLVHAGPIPSVGAVAAALRDVPVIVMSWASDLLIDVSTGEENRARAERAISGAAGVIVDCEAVGAIAKALGAPVDRTLTMPWGVDLDVFSAAPLRNPTQELRLLSLRSLEELYDVETVLRGFAIATAKSGPQRLRLTLAGSGSDGHRLARLATSLGLDEQVRWIGRVPEPMVPDLLLEHDLTISAARSDGSSISLLQSMAMGRPGIVADLASNLEWVDDRCSGVTFRVGSPESLADAIVWVDLNRQRLPELSAASRSVARERADWSTHSMRLLEFYRRVVSTWPSSG